MDVKQAMERAFDGPVSWWPDCCRKGGMITKDDGGGHMAEPTYFERMPTLTAANAALLAHWYNHGPNLLEAVRLLRDFVKAYEDVMHPGESVSAKLDALITAASTVEGI